MTEAPLYEVFSSIQGEATRVGERHLFVRMAGCDLSCAFCDTQASRKIPEHARVFFPGKIGEVRNPLPRSELDRIVTELDSAAGPHHAISLTGGEPQKLLDFPDRVFNFAWSRDGKNLIVARGRQQGGALLITNLP